MMSIAGERVAQVVHQREVSLSKLHNRLKGVVALAAESILVGAAGKRAAVLGALPEVNTTIDEVTTFVQMLLKHDSILFPKGKAAAAVAESLAPATHTVRTIRGKKVLTRFRFICNDRR